MATTTKDNSTKQGKQLSDNQRWVYGFMLLFLALFILLSVVSYYFTWADDQDVVQWGALWSTTGQAVENVAGKFGAALANQIVGQWFGVFGIGIPIVFIILAIRIMMLRRMFLRRSVRITLIAMILGSISMGFLFGTKWGLFGTGLGGAHGIYISVWLSSLIGFLGTGLLLLMSWILLAVYINRNTIKVVNRVGKEIVDTGAKVGGAVGKQAAVLITPNPKQVVQEPEIEHVIENEIEPEPEFIPDLDADFEIVETGTVPEVVVPNEFVDQHGFVISGGGVDSINEDIEVVRPYEESGDGLFEIVDRTSTVSVGGVIESMGGRGFVTTEDGMEVVVAARRDVIVEDKDIESTLYDPTRELSKYQRPPMELLEDHRVDVKVTEQEIYENKNRIIETLENFGITIQKIKATIGPTVTLYEIIPAPGIRISKIKNLEDDIALSLSALGIRIIAPMPGKGTIGIEVPNKDKEMVSMYSVIKSMKFQESKFDLPVVLGKTVQNETFVIDLAKMPHLLVAGATGQGKSVGLNAILTSILYKKHPSEVKLVLVDPKKVELTLYSKLERHFLAKMPGEDEAIITDTHKVIYTLNSLCIEMDNRYDLLRRAEVRHVKEYNEKFVNRRLVPDSFNPEKGHRYLPYIVVVIDEFADMIMTAGREIETPIARLAQLARAIGIHLVIATQRPTTNIITGMIKANFPARIAFRVTSMIDSRTIIDMPGANQLIGRGDMLVSTGSDIIRVQCAFVDTPEIERITEFIGNQRGYAEPYPLPEYVPDGGDTSSKNTDLGQIDPMFEEVAQFIVQNQQGSTSSIQRRFSIGYNRAGRIMDQIEAAGIVGRAESSKPREVLVTDMSSLEMILGGMKN